jgi:hypothetical protein
MVTSRRPGFLEAVWRVRGDAVRVDLHEPSTASPSTPDLSGRIVDA